MHNSIYIAAFVLLGSFWGLSPSAYKVMVENGLAITHIVVFSGLAVGLGLGALCLWRNKGKVFDRQLLLFGLGCGLLLNIPFPLSLLFAKHIKATELAIIWSTAPFFNYLFAILIGRDRVAARRIGGLMLGFLSSAILVMSRGAFDGDVSWWTLAAFSSPVVYAVYSLFASQFWPKDADVLAAGTVESLASAVIAVPALLYFAPLGTQADVPAIAYWVLAGISLMWVVERIIYFSLLRDKGPVYTIQAVYVATPAGVIWGMALLGEQADPWLVVSLLVLMGALWLNNTAVAAKAIDPTVPVERT